MQPTKPQVMDYLEEYRSHKLIPPRYDKVTKGKQLGGEFVGALYFPTHSLIVCSYANNDNLYVDIHGLANSPHDGTPALPHIVLTEADANALENHYSMEENKVPWPASCTGQSNLSLKSAIN